MGTPKGSLSAKQRAQDMQYNERVVTAQELALQGHTWGEIAKIMGVDYKTPRNQIIKANAALLEKQDDFAEQLLAKWDAELLEGQAFCISILDKVQLELAKLALQSRVPADKIQTVEKRGLLALDRYSKLVARHAALRGMNENGRAVGVTILGVASITIALPGAPQQPTAPEPRTVEGALAHTDDSE